MFFCLKVLLPVDNDRGRVSESDARGNDFAEIGTGTVGR